MASRRSKHRAGFGTAPRRRGGRPVVAWALVAALVVQVLGAVAFSSPSLAHSLAAPEPPEAGTPICTAQGIVFVGEDGRSNPAVPKHKEFCVFCLPLLQASKVPTTPADPLGDNGTRSTLVPPPVLGSGIGSGRVWGASFPQAPPSI